MRKHPKTHLMHGNKELDGTHWIMNDRAKCKDKSPLFNKVIDKIANYFNMDIHATRFNLYEKGDEWKPYHLLMRLPRFAYIRPREG